MALPLLTLKGIRNSMGMTQAEMAARIGMSTSVYCQKEKGKKKFTINEMFAILDVVREQFPTISMEALFSCPLIKQSAL